MFSNSKRENFMNKIIKDSIAKNSGLFKDLAKKIYANPELGFEEEKACKWQIQILKKLGFKVENPFCGLKTAYKASKGFGKPEIAFLAEYDALPDIGHACGHNLIAPCSIAAGEALAQALNKEKKTASVIVFGTPAEEGKGGKLKMDAAKVFNNLDLVLMAHPAPSTSEWNGFLAIRRFVVEFFGLASHAAASPEKGLNALDATMFMFHGVNAMRQHILDESRMHGIVNNGGSAPNIIPDYSMSTFYLRAPTEKYLCEIVEKFKKIVSGAATMAGVKFKITEGEDSYKAGLVVQTLNDEFIKIAKDLGLKNIVPKVKEMGSSDFGNVSQRAPGLHCYFSSTKKDCPLHSIEFKKEASTEYAFDAMLKAAETIANLAWKFHVDKSFSNTVSSEFKENRKNCS